MDNEILDCLQNEANKEACEGDTERGTAAYIDVREDASTGSTYKLPLEASYSSLKKLMEEVEHKLDDLLSMLVNNQNEVQKLQNENKALKDNYIIMLDQINIYINELEEIKKQQK
ncbi:palindromic element RPE1 domain-containing protein [Rickettsia honei]|uniref:palindromic element RPE1 domain-containing protein n=1 Tax=Rickettsia honei TaxID=37816 RepID=UPI0003014995|nr:palindromic element RPE1 domain-containing protein [Rickettsia honei]